MNMQPRTEVAASLPTSSLKTIGVAGLGFVLGAASLLIIYLGILTIAQSWEHALQQLAQDSFWVGLVATGYGTQMGLYAYLRAIVHAAVTRGATMATGAGTGTPTIGMVACCAHHLVDVAPLIGLAGFGGVASFLTDWKIPFIIFGLAVNAIGIVITFRNIRNVKASHIPRTVEV